MNTSSLLISLLQRKKSHCIQPPTTVTVLSLMFSIYQCEELLLSRHSSHPLLCSITKLRAGNAQHYHSGDTNVLCPSVPFGFQEFYPISVEVSHRVTVPVLALQLSSS